MKRSLPEEVLRTFINQELFNIETGKEFDVNDIFSAICKRADEKGYKVDNLDKQNIIATLRDLVFCSILSYDEEKGTYCMKD